MFDYDGYRNDVKERAMALIKADLTEEDQDRAWDEIESWGVEMTLNAARENLPEFSDNHTVLAVLVRKPELLDSSEGYGVTPRAQVSDALAHLVCQDLEAAIRKETKVLFRAVGGRVRRSPVFL